MSFTHYPKLDDPIFCDLCYYGPEDPRNSISAPLQPGETTVWYGHAVNFTRYMGSMFCDQPLSMCMDFACDRRVRAVLPDKTQDLFLPPDVRRCFPVDNNGLREITDEDLPGLNYDAKTPEIKYSPEQAGLKFFQVIYGVYIRLSLIHRGDKPAEMLRFTACCSVF